MTWKYCAAANCYEKLYGSATYCSKHNTQITVGSGSSSITTTRESRAHLARELSDMVNETGNEFEYRIEVRTYKDGTNSSGQGLICRKPNN
jgi:hypothetical protein